MGKIALAVHGGAGGDSDFIRKNRTAYEKGIREALDTGYKLLKENGSAVDAVEAAVKALEDNPLFNAGRGSALTAKGEVEMDAAIMEGEHLNSGAVALLKNVRNPVSLAKSIMNNTKYRFLGAHGALEYARKIDVDLEVDAYFITEHQYDLFKKASKKEFQDKKDAALDEIDSRFHGTVGAVALDRKGNVAAATSSGGNENTKEGRIGDSCIIGAGCYANNKICAVSATGDGEFIIKVVIATAIRFAMEYKGLSMQKACDFVVHKEHENIGGDIGVIALDPKGKVGVAFNSERMHRGYKVEGKKTFIRIYK